MPNTKVVNQTGSSIILRQGTSGVDRTLCENLQHTHAYTIKVDRNVANREYLCVDPLDDDNHVVLSPNDCIEFREVRIRLTAARTYIYDGIRQRWPWNRIVIVEDARAREANRLQAQAEARAEAQAQAEAPAEA